MNRPLTVAAVGASAGGVEALRTMFREVATGSNIAFVVLLHLDPDRTSSLPDILSRECALDVVTAEALEGDVAVRHHGAGLRDPG